MSVSNFWWASFSGRNRDGHRIVVFLKLLKFDKSPAALDDTIQWFFNRTWYQCLQCFHFFSKHVAVYIWTFIVRETAISRSFADLTRPTAKFHGRCHCHMKWKRQKPPCHTAAPKRGALGKGTCRPCLGPAVAMHTHVWRHAQFILHQLAHHLHVHVLLRHSIINYVQ